MSQITVLNEMTYKPKAIPAVIPLVYDALFKLESKVAEAKKAQDYFETVYQKEEVPEDILNLVLENTTDNEGLNLINAIAKTEDFKSKSDIRRIFSQRGAKLNGTIVENINDIKDLTSGTVVQLGKSKFYKIIV